MNDPARAFASPLRVRTAFGVVVFVLAVLVTGAAVEADPPGDNDLLTAKPEAVAQWQDMRFGMFVCWGPVTLTGEEIGWSREGDRREETSGDCCPIRKQYRSRPEESTTACGTHR